MACILILHFFIAFEAILSIFCFNFFLDYKTGLYSNIIGFCLFEIPRGFCAFGTIQTYLFVYITSLFCSLITKYMFLFLIKPIYMVSSHIILGLANPIYFKEW